MIMVLEKILGGSNSLIWGHLTCTIQVRLIDFSSWNSRIKTRSWIWYHFCCLSTPL